MYQLKPAFQGLLRPIVNWLARAGVRPNHVTIAALLLSLGAGQAIAWTPGKRILLVLPAVLFARMALNAMDGMLAREHNQKTALGAMLNELGDVIADAGLYLPLAARTEFDPRLVVSFVILAILTEMTGVIGVQIRASRRYDGPFGKSDRAFLIGLLGLLLGFQVPIGNSVSFVLLLMILLSVLTIFNRAAHALRELKNAAGQK